LGGGELLYRVGAYAGDRQRGLTRFEAGAGYLTSLGHSFGAVLGADEVLVRADWFYNDGHPENDAFRDYAHVVSLGGNIDGGDFDLMVDVLAADGLEGVSDAWGFTLLPSYYLTARLQGVARYHHAASEEPGGLSAAPRHEEAAGGGVGDNYNSVYAGLNYYVYGHNLKIMSGIETSRLDGGNGQGWDGWTFFLGTRVSW
jgi:phosphate-selective porin OprO/OprP